MACKLQINAHWLITGAIVEGKQDLTAHRKVDAGEELSSGELKTETDDVKISQSKDIDRIVIFYTDATFKEYSPKSE